MVERINEAAVRLCDELSDTCPDAKPNKAACTRPSIEHAMRLTHVVAEENAALTEFHDD